MNWQIAMVDYITGQNNKVEADNAHVENSLNLSTLRRTDHNFIPKISLRHVQDFNFIPKVS